MVHWALKAGKLVFDPDGPRLYGLLKTAIATKVLLFVVRSRRHYMLISEVHFGEQMGSCRPADV